jgi:cytidine deaminase
MAKLDEQHRTQLVQAALEAQKQAYIPYSHYPVGAAILTEHGTIFSGCNVENASYGVTICAERTAAVKAVSEGAKTFRAVAVVTNNAVFPCGACRQVLVEFAENGDMPVVVATSDGKIINEVSISTLLPGSFQKQDLEEGLSTRKYGAS